MAGGGNRRKRWGREEGLNRTGSGGRGKAIYAYVDCIVFLRDVSSYAQVFISYVRMTLFCFSSVGNNQKRVFKVFLYYDNTAYACMYHSYYE